MSDFRAIAMVTATLSQLLLEAGRAVTGAIVTTGRPKATVSGTEINLYLYQVSPNVALRNADLPTRRPDGTLAQRPQAALDLHYLLTFYGKETDHEPQRLLGSAVRTLHAQPILTRKMIEEVKNSAAASSDLANSDLDQQVETVKFTPLPLNLEELAKLWSTFFQIPYALSVAYKASVVLIEAEGTPRTALPVQTLQVRSVPFRQPYVTEVLSPDGAGKPITFGSTLLIRGERLAGEETKVRLGGAEVTPASLSETQLSLPLAYPPFPADSLRAGVQTVQVVHQAMLGIPPVPHRGVESNLAAFVLSPVIAQDSAGNYLITLANVHRSGTLCSATIGVELRPKVGKGQRTALLLDEYNTPADRAARFYRFEIGPPAEPKTKVEFTITGVESGDYLVRVQVDGVESPLDSTGGGRYDVPLKTIP